MAVPPGRAFLAVHALSLIDIELCGVCPEMGTKNNTTRPRRDHDPTTVSLEEDGSRLLRNYLTAAQSIPHTIGLHVIHVCAKTAYGSIQGVSCRTFKRKN